MSLSWLALLTAISMLVSFNVYLADVIIRMRTDIQIIRRAVGALDLPAPDAKLAAAAHAPATAPATASQQAPAPDPAASKRA